MTVDVLQLIVIIVLAGLCWYANNTLNKIEVLRTVVNVLVVVVSVLLVLQSLGLVNSGTSVRMH